MRRRTYVGAIGALVLAGCSGDGDDGSSEEAADGTTPTGEGAAATTDAAPTTGATADDEADDGDATATATAESTDSPGETAPVVEAWTAEGAATHLAVADGTVIAAREDTLYGLGDGTTVWETSLPATVSSLVATGDTAVATLEGGGTAAYDASDGTELWSRTLFERDRVLGDVATASDHVVRIAGWLEETNYAVFDLRDGEAVVDGSVDARGRTVAGTDGGLAYVSAADGTRAFDAETGQRRWETDVAAATGRGLAAADGRVVAVRTTGAVSLAAADGSERWTYEAPTGDEPRVVALGAGSAFVGRGRGTVAALDDAGERRWAYDITGRETVRPTTVGGAVVATPTPDVATLLSVEDGSVVFEENYGAVEAVATGENRLLVAHDGRVTAYSVSVD